MVAISPGSSGNHGPTNHWSLTVPDFRALISAKNASFFGDVRRSGIGVEMPPKYDASLAAIRAKKEGRADWGRTVRNPTGKADHHFTDSKEDESKFRNVQKFTQTQPKEYSPYG